jgi:hypothetical protein
LCLPVCRCSCIVWFVVDWRRRPAFLDLRHSRQSWFNLTNGGSNENMTIIRFVVRWRRRLLSLVLSFRDRPNKLLLWWAVAQLYFWGLLRIVCGRRRQISVALLDWGYETDALSFFETSVSNLLRVLLEATNI